MIVDAAIVEREMASDKHGRPSPLLTGLAFWLGYSQFGFPEGLVLGPLLIACVPVLFGYFFQEFRRVDPIAQ